MKNTALPLLALILLLVNPGGFADAAGEQTLTGSYRWNNGHPDDLKAIFTATGEDRWDVAFHFRFRGSPEVFSGTARGSLSQGKLEGRVKNRNGRGSRTFTFRGEFEDGTFRGTHAEVFGRRESSTGTLTLAPRGRPGLGAL